ncbi:hypothetical protein BDR26DRAFT_980626 [Obelidium mucronatum]|nr:hypothetical protein BDR26DRAFT_980626 [Obelidium mucronatum]
MTTQEVLQHILQRLPGLLILLLVPFTLFGPTFCPTFFAVYYAFINVALLFTSVRTVTGTWITWMMAYRHSRTDWTAKYDLSDNTSDSNGSASLLINAVSKVKTVESETSELNIGDIVHWIVIPNYKEDVENLRDTLLVLASHKRAKDSYKICLAMEESEVGASEKGNAILHEFSSAFNYVLVTLHPPNLHNEMRGKSSNVAWAAHQISLTISASSDSGHVLMPTTSKASPVNSLQRPKQKRRLQLFTPFSIFDRNSSSVPAFVRLFDMAWSSAQLQYLCPGYPFTPALSAYTIPFDLAREVGFWDRHWGAMAEDMHMTFKIIIATRGRVQFRQIYSPASQSNIVGSNDGWWSGLKARSVQLKRHNWGGVLEFSGVMALGLVKLFHIKSETPTLSNKFLYSDVKEGFVSKVLGWVGSLVGLGIAFYHLFEITLWGGQVLVLNLLTAFFVPGFGPSFLTPLVDAWWGVVNPNGAPLNGVIMGLMYWVPYVQLSMLPCMLLVAIGYEGMFSWCSQGRWDLDQKRKAQDVEAISGITLLGRRSLLVCQKRRWSQMFEWLLFPLVAIYFAISMVYVSLLQIFWGRLDYVVAAKPVGKTPNSAVLKHEA